MTVDLDSLLLGMLGSAMHEGSRLVALRQARKLPQYLFKLHYWLLALLMIVLGGAVASVMQAQMKISAIYIGIAAPAIVSRIALVVPRKLEMAVNEEQQNNGLLTWFGSL